MVNKSNLEPYSCSDGNRNHYVEFSFDMTYFLKSIRIKVADYECSLKTFKIEIIKNNGERYIHGQFVRSKYEDNKGFEEFEINQICKGIKLYLIDNWGEGGGNHIVISKIDFYVSE